MPPSPPAPAGRYGGLWSPPDVAEARQLILTRTDPGFFERTARDDDETLAPWIKPDDTVLDLGCGIGRVALYVAPRCRLLWAVDASQTMLDMAAERLAGRPNVRFARCLDTTIPDVPTASVDVAYSILVLQHLEREDAFLLMRELRRVVKPGGLAYLTFPNLLSDGYLESFVTYAETGEVANPARARMYTSEEVQRILPAAGFQLVETTAGADIVAFCR